MSKESYYKGLNFEKRVFLALEENVENLLGLYRQYCKVFHRKKYYSDKRKGFIEIDISIEVTPPNMSKWITLWAWECKDYTTKVPVEEIDKFSERLKQIGGNNILGGFAISGEIDKTALNVANANGIMVMKLLEDNSFEGVVHYKLLPNYINSSSKTNEKKEPSKIFYTLNKNIPIPLYREFPEKVTEIMKENFYKPIIKSIIENLLKGDEQNAIKQIDLLPNSETQFKIKEDFTAIKFFIQVNKKNGLENICKYLENQIIDLCIKQDLNQYISNDNRSLEHVKTIAYNFHYSKNAIIDKLEMPENCGFVANIRIEKQLRPNEFQFPVSTYRKGIFIPEKYLLYLWLTTFSSIVQYCEINKEEQDENLINIAKNLCRIAINTLTYSDLRWHNKWQQSSIFKHLDIELNEGLADLITENIIQKGEFQTNFKEIEYSITTNHIYRNVINFIMLHEIGHFYNKDLYKGYLADKHNKDRDINKIKQEELEADSFTIELLNQEFQSKCIFKQLGIIIGLSSNLFLNKGLIVEKHPDNDIRIKEGMLKIKKECNSRDFMRFQILCWFDIYHKSFAVENNLNETTSFPELIFKMNELKTRKMP